MPRINSNARFQNERRPHKSLAMGGGAGEGATLGKPPVLPPQTGLPAKGSWLRTALGGCTSGPARYGRPRARELQCLPLKNLYAAFGGNAGNLAGGKTFGEAMELANVPSQN